ncbi:type I-E CRISPR-associated protein Cse1/CasA [Streptomyces melanogenes]|uniref:type I-E CRISPR-associated protein Cse1/CasA n=1 Tax=Streptomyces melanogenes TaxID=67326 RepID=UPI0037B76131
MPSFSLATRPWIDVRDLSGERHTLSGAAVLDRADHLVLDIADPLQHAAVVRFLVTVAIAAGLAPALADEYALRCAQAGAVDWAKAAVWLEERAADFDLFHPERPLFQDASLHELARSCTLPAHYLDHTSAAAMGRPLLGDHRHLNALLAPLAPAKAALLLLSQQMWAVGGRMRCSDADYGPGSNYASHATATGALVWLPHGTLATVLSWRTVPLTELGMANWTYRPRGQVKERLMPFGELDALTWLPRRTLLCAGPDGHVARAYFAQGWHRAPFDVDQAGVVDLVSSSTGKRQSADCLDSPDDLVPLVERWWNAPEGSLPALMRQAARQKGCPVPPVRVCGLAADRKKLLNIRDVTVPAGLLTDPAAADAAAFLTRARHRTRKLPAHLPDLCGNGLLSDPAFRSADEAARARLTARAFRITTSGAAATALTRAQLHRALAPAQKDIDVSLFVTANSTAPSEQSPGSQLEKRLHGIRHSDHGRALLGDLRRWAAAPTPANPAVEAITRNLPAGHRDPAMITAALYAIHSQHQASPYGRTPLPRLMRAFGSGTAFGPRHQPTDTQMRYLLATARPRLLLPTLANLVRYAASHHMTPSWSALADDLTLWSPAIREKWAALFYTSQPLNEIGTPA